MRAFAPDPQPWRPEPPADFALALACLILAGTAAAAWGLVGLAGWLIVSHL